MNPRQFSARQADSQNKLDGTLPTWTPILRNSPEVRILEGESLAGLSQTP